MPGQNNVEFIKADNRSFKEGTTYPEYQVTFVRIPVIADRRKIRLTRNNRPSFEFSNPNGGFASRTHELSIGDAWQLHTLREALEFTDMFLELADEFRIRTTIL